MLPNLLFLFKKISEHYLLEGFNTAKLPLTFPLRVCVCVFVWGGGEVLPPAAFRKIDAGRVHAPFSTIKLKCFRDY